MAPLQPSPSSTRQPPPADYSILADVFNALKENPTIYDDYHRQMAQLRESMDLSGRFLSPTEIVQRREQREEEDRERAERQQAKQEREEREREEQEKAERQKAEQEWAEREKEREERQRVKREKAEQEKAKQEKTEQEKAEQKAAEFKKMEEQRQKREAEQAEQAERESTEHERLAKREEKLKRREEALARERERKAATENVASASKTLPSPIISPKSPTVQPKPAPRLNTTVNAANKKVKLSAASSPTKPITPKTITTPHSPMSLPSPTPSVDSVVPEAKGVNLFPVPKKLPEWHTKVNTTGFTFKTRIGHSQARQTIVALSHMKTCIERCERNKDVRNAEKWAQLFNDLRDSIHKAEITLKVDEYILVKTNMMVSTIGLARILNSKTVPYPWDIKADAWQLFSRWYDGNFEIDLLRGLVTSTDKKRNRDSIDPEYRSKFPASANYYGEGKLVLGQWWPTQLCTVRDGAHGCPQGGIYGERGRGCYSIVLSGMGESAYQDEDNGDDIWYSGTDGKDYQMTDATQRLMDTCKTIHNPVRVIRSHQLRKNNPYRPLRGLRYDGLYDVTEFELMDPVKAVYKFHLVRISDQHPARWGKTQASRPTRFELAAEDKLRGRID